MSVIKAYFAFMYFVYIKNRWTKIPGKLYVKTPQILARYIKNHSQDITYP